MNDEFKQEKRKEVAKAEAYRQLKTMWAWEDLEKLIIKIKSDAIMSLDALSPKDLSIGTVYVAEARGIRKGLDKLMDEIDRILTSGDIAAQTLKGMEERGNLHAIQK